ncbi:hypothetical protein [Thermostaphylospora chromogena]|uniref:Uncharacterized protein n=1 Tax=Thermostaphylospora chromogena TaxID=35622 RepID=A0A1H1BJR1_9ACTN|nr:hypothetical protein [Thermostaphylospora chromogena]SDQ52000.1 hypothetical protein SAMN04489764_0993 [Thermostaphylospora chromogena]
MNRHPDFRKGEAGVERGDSEEMSGAPLTATEKKASARPPSVTPGATPGVPSYDADGVPDAASFTRQKELNPDDFE